jgi:hypothetical protein
MSDSELTPSRKCLRSRGLYPAASRRPGVRPQPRLRVGSASLSRRVTDSSPTRSRSRYPGLVTFAGAPSRPRQLRTRRPPRSGDQPQAPLVRFKLIQTLSHSSHHDHDCQGRSVRPGRPGLVTCQWRPASGTRRRQCPASRAREYRDYPPGCLPAAASTTGPAHRDFLRVPVCRRPARRTPPAL